MSRHGRMELAIAVFVAFSVAGCGSDPGPLDKAEDAMAELDAGRMALAFQASAGSEQPTAPVGFRVEGPFSYRGKGKLPLLDMRYTVVSGGEERVTRVVSTGEAVFVVNGDEVTEVPADQLSGLRLGKGDGGAADLGIAGWVRDAKEERRPDGTRVVSGTADVADLLSDLARISRQAGAAGQELSEDAAQRLNDLARSSAVSVELGEDDLPRVVRAVLDFGANVPEALADALGPYAAARMELTIQLERLTEDLKVDAPVP